MGAGGLSGELRDHSEHVDAILRTHFQVEGQRSGAASSGDSRDSTAYYTFPIPGQVLEEMPCTDCSSNFTIFRRKNLCRNCKRHYCNDCLVKELKFVTGENNRHCLSCRALQSPLAYRENLINLKVKDLQDYLRARHVSMNHCKEKVDLVDLIIRHVEEGSNTRSSGSQAQQSRQQPQVGSAQPRPHSFHSFWSSQARGPQSQPGSFQFHLRDPQPTQVNQSSTEPTSPGKSISDIQNIEDIQGLSVKELKAILSANFVDFKGCCEKEELLQRVRNLWKSKKEYRKKSSSSPDENEEWENQCKICMDAGIDCVLLECGHMVTCTQCGKQISDCPICRQHISRIVHVFKS